MIKRIPLNPDDMTVVNDGTFENVIVLGVEQDRGESLKQQILNDDIFVTAINEYAKSDGLSIHELLVKYEQYKRITQRLESEHKKFSDWGYEGLQNTGKEILCLTTYCITGKKPHEQ